MAGEKIDYASVININDLDAKIAALQALRDAAKAAAALGVLGPQIEGLDALPMTVNGDSLGVPIDLPEGAFKNKSVPACIELYLSTAPMKKKTNKEIAAALREGGVESNANKFDTIIAGALFKLKKDGKILRFKDGWGLSSWYPAHIRGAADTESSKSTKQKGKRARKAKAKVIAEQKSASEPSPVVKRGRGETAQRIAQILRSKPELEFTPEQIAKDMSLNVQVAHMVLAKLAKNGKADKTASGNYRAVAMKPQAVHHAVM